MLSLDEIKRNFPLEVQEETKGMLREYLQTKILEIVFKSKIAPKLTFIGGTALRIVYKTRRFSEDLDFDNKDLSYEDWVSLGEEIVKQLSKQNISVEVNKTRLNDTVFHHNICFPELLYNLELSPHKNQNFLIKADSQDQGLHYEPDIYNLNYFDVETKIRVMPLDIALSQKIRAFMDREMGRDIYDISCIAPQTKPNYDFLSRALNIKTPKELKDRLLKRCQELDLNDLETRALPFLFRKEEISRIKNFPDFVKQHEF